MFLSVNKRFYWILITEFPVFRRPYFLFRQEIKINWKVGYNSVNRYKGVMFLWGFYDERCIFVSYFKRHSVSIRLGEKLVFIWKYFYQQIELDSNLSFSTFGTIKLYFDFKKTPVWKWNVIDLRRYTSVQKPNIYHETKTSTAFYVWFCMLIYYAI